MLRSLLPSARPAHRTAAALTLLTAILTQFAPGISPAETITTENGHFRVHYGPQARQTAREVAVVAEQVYYQLVTAYDLHERFQPIDIIVSDNVDMGNGMADYYQNQAVIWSTNMDYQLRGTHVWLQNVVAHELAHIFSLKLARRYPFRFGMLSASVINSSVADFGVTLPIYSLVAPAWWVEGIAQFESQVFGWEGWDTHRDMLLRMATLEDDLLSYDDMGVFEHNWLKSEMVYNQGYALVRHLADRHGRESVRNLAAHTGFLTFNSALDDVIGQSGSDIYDEWTDQLRAHYGQVRERIGEVHEGSLVSDDGTFEWSPVISPDGTRVAFISNHGEDYLLTQPRILHLASGAMLEIDKRAYGRVSWFPSGDKIVYTRFGSGTMYNDLYVYDISTRSERRVTSQIRAHDPAVSPDGEWIAFVATEDGGTRLGLVRSDGSELRWLTNDRRSFGEDFTLGNKTRSFVQFHGPRWSPDGTRLVFSVFEEDDRDIAMMGTQGPYFTLDGAIPEDSAFPDSLIYPEGAGFRLLVHTEADERDPVWLPDGSGIVYAADYGGIFNLYRCPVGQDSVTSATKLTEVLGGAFSPDISPDGRWLTYVGYHSDNFSIYSIDLGAPSHAERGETVASNVGIRDAEAGSGSAVALDNVADRDYQTIYDQASAEELFRVGPTYGMQTLVGWVPSLRFGPSFIGDDFSMHHVGGSLAVGIEDQSTGRYYYANVGVNKKLSSKDPASTDAMVYAEQSLVPLLTTESTMQPSLYAYGIRSNLGTASDYGALDVYYLDPPYFYDRSGNVIPVIQEASFIVLADTQTVWTNYNYLIGGLGVGTSIGRHFLGAEFSYRTYDFEQLMDRQITNYSMLYDARDTSDVSLDFDWGDYPLPGRAPLVLDKVPQFRENYFREGALSFAWQWGRFTPTVDAGVNTSSGRSIGLSYTYHSISLADSLARNGLETDYDGDGYPDVDIPGDAIWEQVSRSMTVNELTLSYREHIRLPGFLRRTTLTFLGVLAYMDRPLKYYDSDLGSSQLEGWAYWPMRYRLGGGGSLRGYPYFSTEGSKMAFFRASYVFPLIQHFGVQFLHLYHSRTYVSLFAEAGATWNWERISDASIRRDDFLWDVGAELRISGKTFYYLPISAYAAAARRMTDVPYAFVDKDVDWYGNVIVNQPKEWRFYLGLTLGLSGSSGERPDAAGRQTRSYGRSVRQPATPLILRDPVSEAAQWSTDVSTWPAAWTPSLVQPVALPPLASPLSPATVDTGVE